MKKGAAGDPAPVLNSAVLHAAAPAVGGEGVGQKPLLTGVQNSNSGVLAPSLVALALGRALGVDGLALGDGRDELGALSMGAECAGRRLGVTGRSLGMTLCNMWLVMSLARLGSWPLRLPMLWGRQTGTGRGMSVHYGDAVGMHLYSEI